MKKILLEEINKIKSIMGMSLLTESIIPVGFLRNLIVDFTSTVGKNLDEVISGAGKRVGYNPTEGLTILFTDLKKSTDKNVKLFVDSLSETAAKYGKNDNLVFRDLATGEKKFIDEAIEEEIFAKMISSEKKYNFDLYLKMRNVDKKLADSYEWSNYWTKFDVTKPEDIAKIKENEKFFKQYNDEITKNINNGIIGEMRHICSAIQIESGYNLLGFQKYESILAQTSILVNSSILVPIFSIRLKPTCNRSFIKNFRFNIINTGSAGNPLYIALLLNATFDSPLVWNNKLNSIIQYSISSPVITNLATVEYIYTDYIQGQTNRTSYNDALTEIHTPLASSIAGDSDVFTVCAAKISGSASMQCLFNWIEYH